MAISSVPGFEFVGLHCGIKKSGALDLGLIVAKSPVTCAGVYTTNQIVAAPVVQSRARLIKTGLARAIIVNSGNANACTGEQGERDAQHMAQSLAEKLECDVEHVQVCSTGVIGAPLPMPRIEKGIEAAVSNVSSDGFQRFANAILTTDTHAKTHGQRLVINDRPIHILGASKGAGMIHPNMATMLGFIVTDAPIDSARLNSIWKRVCDKTFNAITVDGDTSTNDTALIMANGAAGGPPLEGDELTRVESALQMTADELACAIVRDAEGARKLVRITVDGAATQADALSASNAIALSPLVKTAIHGEDPNWGRIIAAAGRSGAHLNPSLLTLSINDVLLYSEGTWMGLDAEKAAHKIMVTPEYAMTINLGVGGMSRTITTCDLSADYVRINADYRS